MYLVEVKKIKLTLLIFFLLLFFGYSFSIIARENSNNESIFLDSDQDNLSDEDEEKYGTDSKNPDTDGDGYQDGAEVESGYDPTKPAPGDKINKAKDTKALSIDSDSENLTTEFSTRIAEMVAAGQDGGGVDMNSINALIEEKLSGTISFSDLPEVDESKIKIKKQDYSGYGKEKQARKKKEDNEEYLSSIFYIMTNNLPHSIDSKESIQEFSNEIMLKIPAVVSSTNGAGSGLEYFTDLAEKGSTMLAKLDELEVPQDMLDIHKKGLQLSTYAISLKDKVKVDTSDPIASLVSFSEVENIMTLANDYISETEVKLEELGLTNFAMEQAMQTYEE